MINSIFEFDDTVVRDVMTPRTDIVDINVNATLDEILDVIVEELFLEYLYMKKLLTIL